MHMHTSNINLNVECRHRTSIDFEVIIIIVIISYFSIAILIVTQTHIVSSYLVKGIYKTNGIDKTVLLLCVACILHTVHFIDFSSNLCQQKKFRTCVFYLIKQRNDKRYVLCCFFVTFSFKINAYANILNSYSLFPNNIISPHNLITLTNRSNFKSH